ncbi:CBM1 domain-containing protein [Mycena venus]|uniref:CBM1 domain-containing protein n=1 Tax=Mycena venus TaxID=2733690 RepID=A0A8H6X485_9AGAR|nr:CBM1 domain-containing protein [Mycena venus]
MSSLLSLLTTTALLVSSAAAQAQIPAFGQCGGLTYTGSTTCVAGTFCQWDSDFFSQCVPGTAPPPFAGPINFWFPFGDSYTSTTFNASSVLPNIHNPFGNPPFPGFTGGGGENYVGYDTETFNKSVIFTYNYAFGGATINASLVAPFEPTVLSLIDQVNEFLTGGVAGKPATTPWTSGNALFSVWIGVNDMAGSYFEPGDRGAFADTLLDEYFALMQKLVRDFVSFSNTFSSCPHSSTAVGARNFLFLNVPRVDLTPLIIQEGASAQALLKSVIADFNTRLASRVASFKASNAGVTTWLWDSNSVFTTILSAPTQFGFVDAVSFGGTGDFWGNNFHPSQAAHQIFAQDIATLMAGSLWF